jgi:hypothetical protein
VLWTPLPWFPLRLGQNAASALLPATNGAVKGEEGAGPCLRRVDTTRRYRSFDGPTSDCDNLPHSVAAGDRYKMTRLGPSASANHQGDLAR